MTLAFRGCATAGVDASAYADYMSKTELDTREVTKSAALERARSAKRIQSRREASASKPTGKGLAVGAYNRQRRCPQILLCKINRAAGRERRVPPKRG